MDLKEHIYSALESEAGLRADLFLSKRANITRNAAQRVISEESFFLDGIPVKKHHRIEAGKTYLFAEPPVKPSELTPLDVPLDIVFEDSHLIVLNKPRGMVVHPAPGHPDDTLVNALLTHAGSSLSGIGGETRPGIVHRLDKDTSGLLVVAKNDFAHLSLSNQIRDRTFSRIYETVVRGRLPEPFGKIEAAVGRHPVHRKKMAANAKNGKPAVTHYETLCEFPGYSHVRCRLETGRTHQIRVHMAHIGHPVTGDTLYGGGDEFHLDGQCLHAARVEFTHPKTGDRLTFLAKLPDYFKRVLTTLMGRI